MNKFVSRYVSREYEPLENNKIPENWELLYSNKNHVLTDGIEGYFYQVGSNPQYEPSKNYHWFDGDGMVHAIKFIGSKAYYKCAFVETEKFKKEKKAGKSIYPGLTNPINQKGIVTSLVRLINYLLTGKNPFPDTSNTDIVFHHGKLFSLWFLSGNAYQLNIETLKTIGAYKFPTHEGTEQLKYKFSAHPKVCPANGELFFMDFSLSWKRSLKRKIYVGKVSKNGKVLSGRKIEVGGPRVLHDLLITENYVVVADLPIKPSLKGIVEDKGKVTRFGVLSRDLNNADILWFDDTQAYNVLHFINAYEEDGQIIIDGLKQDSVSILPDKNKTSKSASKNHASYLNRWILNLDTGNLVSENDQLTLPVAVEFPSINRALTGRKHRYSYLTKIAKTSTFNYDGFIKYDHLKNTYEMYEYPKNHYCSELQFVPRQGSQAEDDGYLLSWVHILWNEHPSRIHIFEAQDIMKGPVADFVLPNKIPIGFHTEWVSSLDMADSHTNTSKQA